jgi:2-polyprenyl-6-hydroxyphenyl methylase/3-demethylubiquinone-9 3-methyltransferase
MKRVDFNPEWSEEARYVYEHDRVEWWDPAPMPHRYNSYHSYIDMLLGLVEGLAPRTVLNVGCAQATLDLLLAEEGVEVVAVEIREGFLEYARSRYERGNVTWLHGNFLDVQLKDQQFDLVMSHHAIEHVTRPDEFLLRMAGFTRPGGHVLVTTPNQRYLRAGLPSFSEIGDLSRFPEFENSCDGHEHIFAFTPPELCALGRKAARESGWRRRRGGSLLGRGSAGRGLRATH